MARLAILDGYLGGKSWLDITAQPIYSEHEYTIIDDSDPNFIVVEDETGMVRTIPRSKNNDSSALIVAALIAGIMIL